MNLTTGYNQISRIKINNNIARSGSRINKKSKLYKTSVEFEAIFIKQMLNAMKKTVHKTGLMEGGFAENIFEDMLYDEYAKKMAETGNFGLATTLYKQLSASKTIAASVYGQNGNNL